MRRVLLLLLALLLSAHSELRARDPEVEQEDGGHETTNPKENNVPSGEVPPEKAPDRSGNWCPIVQKRVVTTAVMSGTEEYIAKSQSPCPSGVPDCQLIMYKLSTRPMYRQTNRTVTALLWQCCPGHTGQNCDHAVSSAQLDSTHKGHSKDASSLHGSELLEHMDPHQEQNDHQGTAYHSSRPHGLHSTTQDAYGSPDYIQRQTEHLGARHTDHHDHSLQGKRNHLPDSAHPSDHTHRGQQALDILDPGLRSPVAGDRTNLLAQRYQDTPAVLPVSHMMALVMSQLQPVLEAFNRSLVQMQSQLGALTLEVAELKGLSSSPPELQARSVSSDGFEDEERLDQIYQELRETQDQLRQQRHQLDSNHASLLGNLTRMKTDMNVDVQALNRSLSELKLEQKQPSAAAQGSETSALWRAVERLDNRVVNNTVKVQALQEDMEVVSGHVQQLQRLQKDQDGRINDTARRSQVQFMETGLEVEAAKVAVLRRVEELAGNMTLQGLRMAELDVDVDYLYTAHYKQNSSGSGDCGCCSELRTVVALLQRGLTNVTLLANENKVALEESEEQGDAWGDGEWQPAVEALQQELQQLKSLWSLDFEENRTRAMEHNLAELSWSLQQLQAAVSLLQQTEAQRTQDNQHLRGSFNSLLKDAIRHSDVLELLLGEEVLEFLDWPIHDQEAHSIPALQERLRQHEELLSAHNQSIARLTDHGTEAEEVPPADQPSSLSHPFTEWPLEDDSSSTNTKRGAARERQSLVRPQQLSDGSDLWKLEQMVEELRRKVEGVEENQNSGGQRDPRLQDEVMWLKRGLEDHLRVFKNVFSNTDKLAATKQPLELDKVLELVKSRQRRKGGSGNAH